MHHGYALRYIPRVMNWPVERENAETVWLRLMSDFKYDSYRDFLAGSRFLEALLDWLQQFEPEHREQAYQLVRQHLIFISFAEMQHLVARAFPAFVRPCQARRAARKLHIPEYLIWATQQSALAIQEVSRRTLYVGLSDGARLDSFRRANVGVISNEQVILAYEASSDKWKDVSENLKKRSEDQKARFELLVLLDDFAGSGMTLIRWDEKKKAWKGKLQKISDTLDEHKDCFADDCDVLVHHYIGTESAESNIRTQLNKAVEEPRLKRMVSGGLELTFDLRLSADVELRAHISPELDDLVNKYYDPNIMTDSLKVGGDHVKYGFANCGLPLVMEHNAPNNSLALIWAESQPTPGQAQHLIRPLFRRRQRHY
jgi:hypothetical protein